VIKSNCIENELLLVVKEKSYPKKKTGNKWRVNGPGECRNLKALERWRKKPLV
jgi:hypothetical protein